MNTGVFEMKAKKHLQKYQQKISLPVGEQKRRLDGF
jgi:hypothetical protein